MKKGSITKFKLASKKPPKSDWRAFDAMTEEERHQAALSDLDAPPATEAQLARARRVPTVRALRKKLNLTQEEFAARFHLPLGTIRDWEQGAHRPDKAAQVSPQARFRKAPPGAGPLIRRHRRRKTGVFRRLWRHLLPQGEKAPRKPRNGESDGALFP
jgi:putative transcriptional regulator